MRVRIDAIAAVLVLVIASSICAQPRPAPDFAARAQTAFSGRLGGAVVMRVSDGKVIAVVNPDLSCVQLHPPGSIFKLVTAFAALQEGVTTEDAIARCGGQLERDGQVLHCTLPNGHSSLRLPEAIAQSCNITFYGLGLRLGSQLILKYARAFGLDQKCPGYSKRQSIGVLPPKPTRSIQTARLAVGQSKDLSITLLEAARMVRAIIKDDITIPAADANLIHRNLAIIRKSMRLAVVKGTCKNAALRTIEVAGKTGSPEAADDPDERSAWFVGYAPYEKPQVIVAVFVPRGHGYDSAAPIARRIFAAYFGVRQ